MRLSRRLLALLMLVGLAGVAFAALPIPPPPDHRINDYANALSAAERTRLEDLLRERERESSNQIVVAIFRSLEGENLEDYSIRLAQAWRIGQKGLDNGVIFLVFIEDRKMRLEVGYGLESKLTDALSSQILRQVVAPRFREGKTAEGIGAGLTAIEQAIAGTYHAQPEPARGGGQGIMAVILLFIVVAGLFSIIIPALLQSHVRRQGWTGGSRGWGGPIVFPGGWGGGLGGGGSGGGGDFSGGGGGFGGGGASGDW